MADILSFNYRSNESFICTTKEDNVWSVIWLSSREVNVAGWCVLRRCGMEREQTQDCYLECDGFNVDKCDTFIMCMNVIAKCKFY